MNLKKLHKALQTNKLLITAVKVGLGTAAGRSAYARTPTERCSPSPGSGSLSPDRMERSGSVVVTSRQRLQ
jgi:hypothetical protein